MNIVTVKHGAAALLALLLSLGCGGAQRPPTGPIIVPATATEAAPAAGGATLAAAPTAAGTTPASGGIVAPPPRPVHSPAARSRQDGGCLETAMQNMTPEQRLGQLFMVGLSSVEPRAPDTAAALQSSFAGGVVLYGTGWNGAPAVRAAADWAQGLAARATPGVGLFIAGNQEGGAHGMFQAFYGQGFENMPAALEQGRLDADMLRLKAALWAGQLLSAGVNLDLAPVLDTVPPDNPQANAPIGLFRREFGFDPALVARQGAAFVGGMHDGRLAVAIKHFPGLGRVTGNTDFTAQDITDAQTTDADPYLQPFKQGIDAGADFVMVSLATYTRLDAQNPAVFARAIVTDLLRSSLGFGGVIITDDVGAAAAVAAVPPAQRALRFLKAGGDIVLTIQPADIAPMTQAVLAEVRRDPAFAAQIDASVRRVLSIKQRYGLLAGCAAGGA